MDGTPSKQGQDGQNMDETKLTFRKYKDGDHEHLPWQEEIFNADESHKCPTYVHRTPPCQGSCPAGEDIRGWLNIARGIEKPPEGMNWQEYAFYRLSDSNPMPAIMGRVCPAPCEDGCNRNEVEDHVGINAVEQYIGDYALEHGLKLRDPGPDSGKKVACLGGGPASLAAAYQLRRMGHAVTIFDTHEELGGMMRYGIPGYRTPRGVLDGEIKRILDLGVETRMNTKVGVDVSMDDLREEFDAIFVGVGAQSGTALPVPGGDAPNCISGIAFLEAFNDGRLKHGAEKVLVIGGGDTAMDVAAVARRLGHITKTHEKDRPETVVLGHVTHDVATVAHRQGADVTIVYRRPVEKMPATKMEIEHVTQEGVQIRSSLAPVSVVVGEDGRATALRVQEVEWEGNNMTVKDTPEFDIECDLIGISRQWPRPDQRRLLLSRAGPGGYLHRRRHHQAASADHRDRPCLGGGGGNRPYPVRQGPIEAAQGRQASLRPAGKTAGSPTGAGRIRPCPGNRHRRGGLCGP